MICLHGFDTALGLCCIAWNELGVCGSQLPGATTSLSRDRLRQRFPTGRETDQLPLQIAAAVHAVQRLLAGELADNEELLAIVLDDSALPEFQRQVLAMTRQIPLGQTCSYGELAARLGQPGAARAVGQAEGRNPFAPIVPCHRVLASGKGQGGFSAHGGLLTKQRLLAIEASSARDWTGQQMTLNL
ncbi:methylated-DNA--[protein]-cysteine S-methyltransferase [Paucibacter sp. DJ1R-11]|uniref:methylated-DNA--[protein]-cysteine S-methyltransferase n=1 Tax=Paucibacter sp. DJ1R-11 TaxID=2893556 RepID=UPI0021E49EF7|nr:methylated-DNA--[protein]-cysteine S-methyltransferase [Paucibacter sp. DJ1R-11]MCV2366056.1 methylated-DNA--[protein]-cysteine S-methyltransferase [Paucibacter sp. DJ1R-11]